MSLFRGEKLAELFKHAAATFLQNEANGSSLITVTNATVSDDGKYATIFFTVLPVDKEKTALEFAKRSPLRERSTDRGWYAATGGDDGVEADVATAMNNAATE